MSNVMSWHTPIATEKDSVADVVILAWRVMSWHLLMAKGKDTVVKKVVGVCRSDVLACMFMENTENLCEEAMREARQ